MQETDTDIQSIMDRGRGERVGQAAARRKRALLEKLRLLIGLVFRESHQKPYYPNIPSRNASDKKQPKKRKIHLQEKKPQIVTNKIGRAQV